MTLNDAIEWTKDAYATVFAYVFVAAFFTVGGLGALFALAALEWLINPHARSATQIFEVAWRCSAYAMVPLMIAYEGWRLIPIWVWWVIAAMYFIPAIVRVLRGELDAAVQRRMNQK